MPSFASWADVPVGEQTRLDDLATEFGNETGWVYALNQGDLINLANLGATSLSDIGRYMTANAQWLIATQPWAGLGLDKDTYAQQVTTFGTEYKKVTGQEIPPEELAKAFQFSQSGGTASGGILTGGEYAQQLMNDAAIQKTYGWVKYGLDYNQFQQQKLQMRQAVGSELSDAQAVTQLQYWHTNQGANESAHAQTPQGQQKERGGATQSVIR